MSERTHARTVRAERLLEDAMRQGRVELPTLTRDELAALGGLDSGPWRDADELSWWSGMSEETRTAVTVAALRGLGARGLIDVDRPPSPGEASVRVPVAPELGAVLVARWACAPATIDESGRPRPMLRTVELIRPGPAGPAGARLLVLVGTDACAVSEVGDDDQPGEPAPVSAEDLQGRLARLLPGGAR